MYALNLLGSGEEAIPVTLFHYYVKKDIIFDVIFPVIKETRTSSQIYPRYTQKLPWKVKFESRKAQDSRNQLGLGLVFEPEQSDSKDPVLFELSSLVSGQTKGRESTLVPLTGNPRMDDSRTR